MLALVQIGLTSWVRSWPADVLPDHTGLLGPIDDEVEGGVDPLAEP